jgi:TonB family protein
MFGEEMRLDKRATTAVALWFSLAQGVLAQGAHVSDNAAAGIPCMAVNPPHRSTIMSKEVQDTVIMRVRISKSGVVHDMEVVSGPRTLTAAAIKAVKRWKYVPASWVTGPPSERYTFLFITLVKGATPKVEEGVPAGVPGCIPAPQHVRVSQTLMEKLLLSRVEPIYPPEAHIEHIEGIVVVRVTIDKGGNVYKADSVSGPPVLVPAAIEAAKQWKYQPFLINGGPVEVETTLEISFTL